MRSCVWWLVPVVMMNVLLAGAHYHVNTIHHLREEHTALKQKYETVLRIQSEPFTQVRKQEVQLALVYCCVPFVWTGNTKMMTDIMKTWGSRCDGLGFFVFSNDETIPTSLETESIGGTLHPSVTVHADVVRFGDTYRPEGDRNLIEKMARMFLWVHEHRFTEFEWFWKIDYDAFPFVENMRSWAHLDGIDHNDEHFLGTTRYHQKSRGAPAIVVGQYIMSRGALVKFFGAVNPVYTNSSNKNQGSASTPCSDYAEHSDDFWISLCFHHLGLEPGHSRDAKGRELFFPFFIADSIKMHHEDGDWYWEGVVDGKWQQGPGPQLLMDHLSTYPFAVHGYEYREEQHLYNTFVSLYLYHADLRYTRPKFRFWHDEVLGFE